MTRRIIPPADATTFTHGGRAYTNHGCRCDECRQAHTRQMAAQRTRRIARLAAGDPTIIIDHGSESTYNNWRCRCDPCKAAHSVVQARYRQARRQP